MLLLRHKEMKSLSTAGVGRRGYRIQSQRTSRFEKLVLAELSSILLALAENAS